MTALSVAVANVKDQVESALSGLTPAARIKSIKKLSRDAESNVEAVRRKLADRGETDESVWQREMSEAEAPYWAAMELWPDACPADAG